MRHPIALATISMAAAAAACSKKAPEPVMCTMEARSALAIVVVDSVTGVPLAASARILVHDGAFTDSLIGHDSIASGIFERPGTYRIEVSAPGYGDWSRDGVTVEKDECHVKTVRVRAPLAAK